MARILTLRRCMIGQSTWKVSRHLPTDGHWQPPQAHQGGGARSNTALHLTASNVRCAAVVHAASPSQMGRMQRSSLGQRLTCTRKGKGTRACRESRAWREDAETMARRDPRDLAKAAWPAVQCPSVKGGPLATASHRQVDSSSREADGLGDLC